MTNRKYQKFLEEIEVMAMLMQASGYDVKRLQAISLITALTSDNNVEHLKEMVDVLNNICINEEYYELCIQFAELKNKINGK